MKNRRVSAVRHMLSILLGLLLAVTCALPAFALSGVNAKGGMMDEHVHVPAGEPAWHWSENDTACTAVFTCAVCGETFSLAADVSKEWRGEGPDKTGGGRYCFMASVSVNGKTYTAVSPEHVTEGYKAPNPCPWDGIDHGDGFSGRLIRFFHKVLYSLVHLFERNRYGA